MWQAKCCLPTVPIHFFFSPKDSAGSSVEVLLIFVCGNCSQLLFSVSFLYRSFELRQESVLHNSVISDHHYHSKVIIM